MNSKIMNWFQKLKFNVICWWNYDVLKKPRPTIEDVIKVCVSTVVTSAVIGVVNEVLAEYNAQKDKESDKK